MTDAAKAFATHTLPDDWAELATQYQRCRQKSLREFFADDPKRFEAFHFTLDGLLLDISKNHLDETALKALLQFAEEKKLSGAIETLFQGEVVNRTQRRAALHTALRQSDDTPVLVNKHNVIPEIKANLDKMKQISHQVRAGDWRGVTGKAITDVVNVGIGGSDLGPAMVTEALKPYHDSKLRCHFVSNIDEADLQDTLRQVHPETTLFIITSKSFTTTETLLNAETIKQWWHSALGAQQDFGQQCIAITAEHQRAIDWGVPESHSLTLWDWVGGRFSIWSSVGLSVMLAIGPDAFEQLLRGAESIDRHFREAPLPENMPVLLALIDVWYTSLGGCQTRAILPYSHQLKRFTAYLQQLSMESNGKCVHQSGEAVSHATHPILWGQIGCNGQHAYHQLLFQGTHAIPSDFLVAVKSSYKTTAHQHQLLANCLSQTQALMFGKTIDEVQSNLRKQGLSETEIAELAPHKMIPGDQPSSTLIVPEWTPYHLGQVIALYEHKVFAQSVLWDINPFDQWGVELGKVMSHALYQRLSGESIQLELDSSTEGLLAWIKS